MMMWSIAVPILIDVLFVVATWHEVLCVYRNSFPLFTNNNEKRFHEIVADKLRDYKTRSLLKDAGYSM